MQIKSKRLMDINQTTTKKTFFFFVGLALLSFTTSLAQIKRNATITDFSSLKANPLIAVIESEESQEVLNLKKKIASCKKEKKKSELQEELHSIIKSSQDFNKLWKSAVTEIWKLNTTIEFKTIEEVKKLAKSGVKKYSVLMIKNYSAYAGDLNMSTNSLQSSRIGFNYIAYSNIQNIDKFKKLDYLFFLQKMNLEYNNSTHDMAMYRFNLALAQKHIKAIEFQKDSKLTLYDFVKQQKKLNCHKLDQLKVKVDKETLYKMARKNPNKSFLKGHLDVVNKETIAQLILNQDDQYIAIPLLSSFVKSSSLHYKIIVNTKTLEIISCTNRATAIDEFLRIDLKSISKCK